MKKDRDIGISAGDCGEPREIEYANEEEWPPNSRQVLYYFSAMGFPLRLRGWGGGGGKGGGRKKRKREGRSQTNLFRQAARNLFQKPSPECREMNERLETAEPGSKGEGEARGPAEGSLNAFKSLHQAVRSHGHTQIPPRRAENVYVTRN